MYLTAGVVYCRYIPLLSTSEGLLPKTPQFCNALVYNMYLTAGVVYCRYHSFQHSEVVQDWFQWVVILLMLDCRDWVVLS
jgi:hypothetical protein